MATVIFFILWQLRKRFKTPGVLFAIYCMFNGAERFFIEKIRVNAIIEWGGFSFTQAELISSITFVSGALLLWYLTKKR
jgi:prolipoprotein diacylglyceryltransferase